MPNLAEISDFLDSLTFFIITLLILLQMVALLIVPPDQAEKINFLGKLLEYLVKFKFGGGQQHDRKDTKN